MGSFETDPSARRPTHHTLSQPTNRIIVFCRRAEFAGMMEGMDKNLTDQASKLKCARRQQTHQLLYILITKHKQLMCPRPCPRKQQSWLYRREWLDSFNLVCFVDRCTRSVHELLATVLESRGSRNLTS